jgi:hypothetical protein
LEGWGGCVTTLGGGGGGIPVAQEITNESAEG